METEKNDRAKKGVAKMTKLYIPFYFEWAEELRHLSDAEYGKLIKAILGFAMGENLAPKLSRDAKMAYKLITSSISRSEGKRLSGANEQNAPSKRDLTPKTFKRIERESPTNTSNNDNFRESKDTEHKISADLESVSPTNDSQNLVNCDQSPTNSKISPTKPSQGEEESPPTMEQVRNFFKSRNFKSNPDEFFNFYESNGWKVGQNPMKNWHSSAENWESRVNRERNLPKTEDAPHRYGDFDVHEAFKLALERSYSDIDEEDEEMNEKSGMKESTLHFGGR